MLTLGDGMVRTYHGYGKTILSLPDESGRFQIWSEPDAQLGGILRGRSLRLIFEANGCSAAIGLRWPSEIRKFRFLTGDEARVRVIVASHALSDAA